MPLRTLFIALLMAIQTASTVVADESLTPLVSPIKIEEESINACQTSELSENIKLLHEQQKFAQKQTIYLESLIESIAQNHQVVSTGAGLQKAFLGLSSYAMTTALLLEGFGVKSAGGLIGQGRLATIWSKTSVTKWQAFRKVMLFTEESLIYPLAPNIFSGYSAPSAIGEGLGEVSVGGERPLENEYDVESLPLTGFQKASQWNQFQTTLIEDLRTFYKIHQDIYAERQLYDQMIKGITFKYSMAKQKEFFQKLYDETTAHKSIYQFQKNYLKIIEKKLTALCSNKIFLETIPDYSPLILKGITVFTEADYLKNISRFPAPAKKALNRFESYSLSRAKIEAEKYKNASWLSEKVKAFLIVMADLMNPIQDSLRQARLDRLVNRLRPFVYDNGMRECYRAHLMGSELENAINIGCDIYVTNSLMDRLNDLQLLGVLAHELSHGDQGHLVVNLMNEGTSLKKHILKYFSEVIEEATSDVTKTYLDSIRKSGHFDNFLTTYSELAPKIEIQADQGAVLILTRAGIDRKHLIDALIILHKIDPTKVDMNHPETLGASDHTNGVRNYPGLFTRIRSINAVVTPKKPMTVRLHFGSEIFQKPELPKD